MQHRTVFVSLLLVGFAAAQRNYLPPRIAGGPPPFNLGAPFPRITSGGGPIGGPLGGGRPIAIISLTNDNPGDGTYSFSYETENGIQAQEQGQLKPDGAEGLQIAQGSFAFTAPDDNVRYSIAYTADENGFQPQGAHLPTPPPIPAEILRALEQNAADEARGIVDDGSYREEGVRRAGAGTVTRIGGNAPAYRY